MYRNILSKYRERKIFRQILLSIFFISVFFIILVCTFGFKSFYDNARKDMIQAEEQTMANFNVIFDSYLSSAESAAQFLYQNSYVKMIIAKNQTEWNDNMSMVASNIVNTVKVNPNFHSVYVIGTEGILTYGTNFSHVGPHDMDERVEEAFGNSYGRSKNTWTYEDIRGEQHYILSITAGDGNIKRGVMESGICINLEIGEIFHSIFPATREGESYLLLDGEGNILGERGGLYEFGSVTGEFDDLRDGLTGKEPVTLTRTIGSPDGSGREKVLMTGIRSTYYDYYLIHRMPANYFSDSAVRLGGIAALSIFLLTLLSLGLSWLISRQLYHPIDQVVDNLQTAGMAARFGNLDSQEGDQAQPRTASGDHELSIISGTISAMIEQMNHYKKEAASDKMIHFLSSRQNYREVPEEFRDYVKESFADCCYFVQVIQICDKEAFVGGNTESAIRFQLETICGLIETQYEEQTSPVSYVLDQDSLVTLLFVPRETSLAALETGAAELIRRIRTLLSLEVNVGISHKEYQIDEIKMRFKAARAAISYRFVFGRNTVITEKQMQESALHGSSTYELRSLEKAVKDSDETSFQTAYSRIEDYIRQNALQTGYELLVEAAFLMHRYYLEISTGKAVNQMAEYEKIKEEIWNLSYMEDARRWFFLLYQKISEAKNQAMHTGTADLVRRATQYIQENYQDMNLNAQYMAGILNITPSYFSRIFNDYMQCPFPDYLANVRLEAGRKLLLEKRDMSIKAICESVGYTNFSYFIASFKKRYGVPPGKYRLNNRLEEE